MPRRKPIPLRPHALAALVACATWAIAITLTTAAPSPAQAATQNDQTQFSVIPGSLAYATAPGLPTLGSVTLNGQAQTTTAQMTNFAVADATGSGSGWDVTVAGLTGTGDSPVFKQYCPTVGGCGGEPQGYITGGATLPADSLTLNSSGASFAAQNGSTAHRPSLELVG